MVINVMYYVSDIYVENDGKTEKMIILQDSCINIKNKLRFYFVFCSLNRTFAAI